MKKNIFYFKCRILAGLTLVAVATGMSGCGSNMKLSTEQQDMVAEYAVQAVLKYDANYSGKFVRETTTAHSDKETTTSEGESTQIESSVVDDSNNKETSLPKDTDSETKKENTISLSEACGMHPANLEYNDYDILDTYPSGSDAMFVLKPKSGKKLLIANFTLSNTSAEAIDIKMMNFKTSIKAVINDSEKDSALVTLLADGLNTYTGTLAPGQSQKLVLAFETNCKDKADISELKLRISDNGNVNSFDLK